MTLLTEKNLNDLEKQKIKRQLKRFSPELSSVNIDEEALLLDKDKSLLVHYSADSEWIGEAVRVL